MSILKKQSVAIVISAVIVLLSGFYMASLDGQENEIYPDLGQGYTAIEEPDVYIDDDDFIEVPDQSVFIEAPAIIYTTLASENGLADTFMFTEGRVGGFGFSSGTPYFYISNAYGRLAILPTELDRSFDYFYNIVNEGDQARVYFVYLGMSEVLGMPAGIYTDILIFE